MGTSSGVIRFVTMVMGVVIGLTFLFGFGNVLALALRIGVPAYVAPLVAPAVDLTVLGLLVGTRHLALCGVPDRALQPARRLLVAASAVTLALNVPAPVCAGQWGKAAFDSVGPLLLIGWAETGPGLLRALSSANVDLGSVQLPFPPLAELKPDQAEQVVLGPTTCRSDQPVGTAVPRTGHFDDGLVARARCADAEHCRRCLRPISADSLRKELRVSAKTSRALVAVVRSENAQRAGAVGLKYRQDSNPLVKSRDFGARNCWTAR